MKYTKFISLIEEWYKDTAHMSVNKADHPSCKKILSASNKDDVIGYAFLSLEAFPYLALIILNELVHPSEKPPIPKVYNGRIPVFVECWKYWGYRLCYVYSKHDVQSYWVEDKYGNKGEWH